MKYYVLEITSSGYTSIITPNKNALSLLEAQALLAMYKAHPDSGCTYVIAEVKEEA